MKRHAHFRLDIGPLRAPAGFATAAPCSPRTAAELAEELAEIEPTGASGTATSAAEHLREVEPFRAARSAGVAKVAMRRASHLGAFKVGPEAVVHLALLIVAEHVVRLLHLFELLFGRGVVGMQVRDDSVGTAQAAGNGEKTPPEALNQAPTGN